MLPDDFIDSVDAINPHSPAIIHEDTLYLDDDADVVSKWKGRKGAP